MGSAVALDPADIGEFQKALNDAAGKASILWTTFVTLELYLMIAFGSVTHRDLLLQLPLKLPLLGVDLPLIGFFINILALRVDLSGEPTGEQVLEQVRQLVLDGLAHQSLPFEHVQEALPELRPVSGESPLPVMLRHQNYPETEIQRWAGGLQASALPAAWTRPAKSDLDLQYYGDANDLRVTVEYDSSRFSLHRVETL